MVNRLWGILLMCCVGQDPFCDVYVSKYELSHR